MPKSQSLALLFSLMLVLSACAERVPLQTAALPVPGVSDLLPPQPKPVPLTAEQLAFRAAETECLAKAIYFEARGETETGRRAVAAVVLNRVAKEGFPDTVCGVVRQGGQRPPCQFSWWCDGKSDTPTEGKAWAAAQAMAEDAMEGWEDDPSHGALFFHHTSVRPGWRRSFEKTVRIGTHIFYRLREAVTEVQPLELPTESGGGD